MTQAGSGFDHLFLHNQFAVFFGGWHVTGEVFQQGLFVGFLLVSLDLVGGVCSLWQFNIWLGYGEGGRQDGRVQSFCCLLVCGVSL